MIKKVGLTRLKNNAPSFFYRDVIYDKEGWADASKYLPEDYDLVFLKIEGKDICHGWSTGQNWDGCNIKRSDNILSWKRKQM